MTPAPSSGKRRRNERALLLPQASPEREVSQPASPSLSLILAFIYLFDCTGP